MGFHFVDYVVHGWDVAATLGVPFELPADVVAAVLPLALGVPDGDFREPTGSPFARTVAPLQMTPKTPLEPHPGPPGPPAGLDDADGISRTRRSPARDRTSASA